MQNGPRPPRDESLDSRGTTLIGTECPLNGVREHTPASVTAGESVQAYSQPSQAAFGWRLRKDFRWVYRARLSPQHRALCAPTPAYSFPSSPLLYIVSHRCGFCQMLAVCCHLELNSKVVAAHNPLSKKAGSDRSWCESASYVQRQLHCRG